MILKHVARKLVVLLMALGACTTLLSTLAAEAQTFTAPVVSTSSRTTISSDLLYAQAVAVDASGNIFYTRPNSGVFAEKPASGGAEITLIASGLSWPKGVAVDNSGNSYVTDYNGHLWRVPAGGGTAVDILTACGSIDGYYLGTQVVAVDGSGSVYTVGNNIASIFKITSAGVCSLLVNSSTLGAVVPSHIAADPAGNVYYSLNSDLYALYAGSTTPTQISVTSSAINGLRSDNFGNLFITDTGTVDEVPFVNGVLDGSRMFAVLPYSSAYDIGTGLHGELYTTDGTILTKSTSGSIQFGTVNVGSTSATQSVNVLFNSAAMLSSLRYASGVGNSSEIVNPGTGTCAIGQSYSSGSSCTLDLQVAPAGVGARNGEVLLSSSTGVIGAVYVAALGQGAGLVADPGLQASLGSGWSAPDGVAIDPQGNIVVADKSLGTVSYIQAGASSATTIASSLSEPGGLAVAADGSVYVANTGAGSVFEIPYVNDAYSTSVVIASGLSSPSALALSGNGDLYIANTGAGTVLRIPNQAGALNTADQVTVGSGFTSPAALAIDGAGNLFVADSSTGDLTMLAGSTQSTVATGLSSPSGLALDAAGDLYILQSGSTTIRRLPYTGGAYSTNSTTELGTKLTSPSALAADSAGNLYVTDQTVGAVVRILRTNGALDLGKANEGSSSAEESLMLSNIGNSTLIFGSPLYQASGDTASFSVTGTSSDTCAAGASLISGSNCGVYAIFAPTVAGGTSENLTFTSNAVNSGSMVATLSGTGTDLPKTTLTLTLVSPTGTLNYGQTVNVSATLGMPSGSTGTPTGTVQFLVNGKTYGAPVTLSSGVASSSITNLAAGSDTINAVYSGDDYFSASTATALTLQVALASTSTVLTSSAVSATPVVPGTSVTLTATVSSNVTSASPTGTVTFKDGATVLGTSAVDSTGVAKLVSTALPEGTYSVAASYSGDSGFATSTSNSVEVAILTAQYVVSSTPSALTLAPATGYVSGSFVVTPISGYTGGVDMACSGLPANVSCTFTPGVIYFANTTDSAGKTISPSAKTVLVTLTSNTSPATTVAVWILPFGGVLLTGLLKKRKGTRANRTAWIGILCLLLVVSLLSVLSLAGCSNSSSSLTPRGTSNVTVTMTGTPSGTTTVPSNGTGNITKNFTFTLTVQ